MLNAPWWLMPGVMFGINLYVKSKKDAKFLYILAPEGEVKKLPVIMAIGKAEKAEALPAPPGGYRWKEITLTYSVSPFSPPSDTKVHVLEQWLNGAPKPGGATMSDYDELQGFKWGGETSPGAGSFLTAEYLRPGVSPRGGVSDLSDLIPREEVLYAPTTGHDFGALGHRRGGGGGHRHHHRGGGRGWGGGWGGGYWGPGPLYAEDLPVIIVEGQERRMTAAEWEEYKKKKEEEKKKKALSSFVDAEALSTAPSFGSSPDDVDVMDGIADFGRLAPNDYSADAGTFMGKVEESVQSAFDAMKGELRAKGLMLKQIPTNQAVVGDFVVTAECKLCTIQGHQQGGLVLREIHPGKGQLWHYKPGVDAPFACAFGVRRAW